MSSTSGDGEMGEEREPLKFSVSYGRVVQVKPYETARFNVMIENYKDEVPVSWAFAEARAFVENQVKKLGAVEVVA